MASTVGQVMRRMASTAGQVIRCKGNRQTAITKHVSFCLLKSWEWDCFCVFNSARFFFVYGKSCFQPDGEIKLCGELENSLIITIFFKKKKKKKKKKKRLWIFFI
jgi:hypothetical protein